MAPWAEWEGSIADEAVDEAAVDRVVSVLQGPISAWAERVTRRQTAADNGYATPEAMSEAGAAAAELVREAMNRSGVVSMVMEGRGLPHTRTINAGVIIDPSDIP